MPAASRRSVTRGAGGGHRISTFYLPPKYAAPADETMLTRLGLLTPGRVVKAPDGPLREIDRYGPRELRAFDDFARFRVPAGYHWQDDTAAARFALALREDRDLRDHYIRIRRER